MILYVCVVSLHSNLYVISLLQFATSVQDRNLNFISDDLVKTGEFLRNFRTDPRKLQCLEKFIKHQELVRWIREETGSKSFMPS